MADLTPPETLALQDLLERQAASVLGRILFEFSRLEMELGLCVVWVEGGARLEQLTRRHEQSNFSERLASLRESVDRLLPRQSTRHTAYFAWLDRAEAARKLRNELMHGRWGVEAANERIVNVIGLPTSPNQRAVTYSLAQLQERAEQLCALRKSLAELRRHYPL